MYKIIIITLGLFLGQSTFAQVGVNTISPQETLDINGTLRVQNTGTATSSKVLGRDNNGTVGTIDVGDNVVITNNTIHAVGASDYGIVEHTIVSNSPGTQFHNLDLDLDTNNLYKVVIRLVGANNSFEFTGIQNGTDGRHVVLLNLSTSNFRVYDEDLNSLAANRILTLGNSFESTSGMGAIELVYDGSLSRWLVLNVRN